jgi:hypothetical protein
MFNVVTVDVLATSVTFVAVTLLVYLYTVFATNVSSDAECVLDRKPLPTLPMEVLRAISDAAVIYVPTGVCKDWETRRAAWWHVTSIQRAYRLRIRHSKALWSSAHPTQDALLRMYTVDYPFEFLQRWPDLAARKCPGLSTLQRNTIQSLPLPKCRTRRQVREIMSTLTVSQIMYVGW